MFADQVVQLAVLTGRTILENGGEIYRVEETVARVCVSFGFAESHAYATPTALIVSVVGEDGRQHSAMERTVARGVNLDKVDAVNALSRSFEKNHPDIDAALAMIRAVRNRKTYSNRTVIALSALTCSVFPLLFGGSPRDMLPAALAGALIRVALIQLNKLRLGDFIINAIGGSIAAFSGWLAVQIGMGENPQAIITSAIMLLVPGLLLTNAVRDIAAGDMISGISRLMEAFFVAISIACGTALAYLLIPYLGGGSLW